MGEMTVVELLESAQRELAGLSDHLKDGDGSLASAYVGSIMARVANAQIKIGG